MLQAAVSGAFDYTQNSPEYYTRLQLVLRALIRQNQQQAATHAAMHFAIAAAGTQGEAASKNSEQALSLRRLFLKLLYLSTDQPNEEQELVELWKQQNNIHE